MKALLYLIIALLLVATTEAATIQGSIYTLDLTLVENAVVDISTTPHQRLIAKEGTYLVTVPKGTYTITAKAEDSQNNTLVSHDTLIVQDEGVYTIDLILFPNLEEDEEFLEDISLPVEEDLLNSGQHQPWLLYTAMIVVFLAAFFLFAKMMWNKRKSTPAHAAKPSEQASVDAHITSTTTSQPTRAMMEGHEEKENNEPPDSDAAGTDDEYGRKIIDFIKSNEGRVTQKDIRKQLPLSEAKVSLVITELEHLGKIKKIKKGRGNIIVLS